MPTSTKHYSPRRLSRKILNSVWTPQLVPTCWANLDKGSKFWTTNSQLFPSRRRTMEVKAKQGSLISTCPSSPSIWEPTLPTVTILPNCASFSNCNQKRTLRPLVSRLIFARSIKSVSRKTCSWSSSWFWNCKASAWSSWTISQWLRWNIPLISAHTLVWSLKQELGLFESH